MNTKIAVSTALALFAVSANAAISFLDQTITLPSTFVPPSTGGVAFAGATTFVNAKGALDPVLGYLPAMGPLTSVSYSIDGYSYVTYNVTSGTSPSISLQFANVSIKGPAVTSPALGANVSIASTPVVLNVPGTLTAGPISVASQVDPNTGTYNTVSPVAFSLDSTGVASASGTDSVTATVAAFSGGKVFLHYVYTTQAVPEASTYAALGFLGLAGGFLGLRRRLA